MGVRIVLVADLFQGLFEEIANDHPLADMQISQWVEMDASRLAEILVRAGVERFPGMMGRPGSQVDRCPATVHDRALILDLSMCFRSLGIRLGDTDHTGGEVKPFRRHERVLRALAQSHDAIPGLFGGDEVPVTEFGDGVPYGLIHRSGAFAAVQVHDGNSEMQRGDRGSKHLTAVTDHDDEIGPRLFERLRQPDDRLPDPLRHRGRTSFLDVGGYASDDGQAEGLDLAHREAVGRAQVHARHGHLQFQLGMGRDLLQGRRHQAEVSPRAGDIEDFAHPPYSPPASIDQSSVVCAGSACVSARPMTRSHWSGAMPVPGPIIDRIRELIGGGVTDPVRVDGRWTYPAAGDQLLRDVEPLLAAFDPGAHVTEDMFETKVAFAALLNFPLTKLADRMQFGRAPVGTGPYRATQVDSNKGIVLEKFEQHWRKWSAACFDGRDTVEVGFNSGFCARFLIRCKNVGVSLGVRLGIRRGLWKW